jgi:hypothetical protein
MLEPTIHHLFQTLPYLAEVMQIPLAGLEVIAAVLAAVIGALLVVGARSLTQS